MPRKGSNLPHNANSEEGAARTRDVASLYRSSTTVGANGHVTNILISDCLEQQTNKRPSSLGISTVSYNTVALDLHCVQARANSSFQQQQHTFEHVLLCIPCK